MKYGKMELRRRLRDVVRKGWTDTWIADLIDSLWRDEWTSRTSGFELAGGGDSVIAFDDASRTFTIAPKVKKFSFYQFSERVAFFRRRVEESLQLPDQTGLYLVYYDQDPEDPQKDQKLFYEMDPPREVVERILQDRVLVAWIYWDAPAGSALYFGDARHGSQWSPQMHWWANRTLGSLRESGLCFTRLDPDQDGSADTHAQFGISGGRLFHDDIQWELPGVEHPATLPVFYRDPAGVVRCQVNPGFGILGASGLCYCDNGVITPAGHDRYVLYHVFATNCLRHGVISVAGFARYESVTQASLNLQGEVMAARQAMPHSSMLHIGSLVFHGHDGYTNAVKAAIVSAHSDRHVTAGRVDGSDLVLQLRGNPDVRIPLPGWLLQESDPVFAAHVASSITQTLINNWSAAFSWGNHAQAGYLHAAAANGMWHVQYNGQWASLVAGTGLGYGVINQSHAIMLALSMLPNMNPSLLSADDFLVVVDSTHQMEYKITLSQLQAFLGSGTLNAGKGIAIASSVIRLDIPSLDAYASGLSGSWQLAVVGSDHRRITLSSLGSLALYNASRLQGAAVAATAPANGQLLRYVGTENRWEPVTLVEDIAFEFRDIEAGVQQVYDLDVGASFWYQIQAAMLESDGTLAGVRILLDTLEVGGLSGLSVTPTRSQWNATGMNTAMTGSRVQIVTSTSYSGSPTLIRGKLKITRI